MVGRRKNFQTMTSMEGGAFTSNDDALSIADQMAGNVSDRQYPTKAVAICQVDIMARDGADEIYHQQILARDRIFQLLLDEFSQMVDIDHKNEIQNAAPAQVLVTGKYCLSHQK